MYRVSNFTKITIFALAFFVSLASLTKVTYAAGINNLKCEDLHKDIDKIGGDEISPVQILCPIFSILNALILFVGVVFVVMVIWGSIKMAMALGDPKGYQGAHLTWTFAILGGLVVMGYFVILSVILGIIGVSGFPTPEAIEDKIANGFATMLCNTCMDVPGFCTSPCSP